MLGTKIAQRAGDGATGSSQLARMTGTSLDPDSDPGSPLNDLSVNQRGAGGFWQRAKMPPWEPAPLPGHRRPTRGTQGRAGCSAGTAASCPRRPPSLRPWATCPAAAELQFLPLFSLPPNPYQLQRKLEEMHREIRRCYATASLRRSEERMRGTTLPSSIPRTHVTGWSREAKVLPRHPPAPTGHCGPLSRLTRTLLLHQLQPHSRWPSRAHKHPPAARSRGSCGLAAARPVSSAHLALSCEKKTQS